MRIEEKRQDVVAFVTPQLLPGERVLAGLASSVGPWSPYAAMVPIVGAVVSLTSRLRNYGLVVTSQRVFLVRLRQVRPRRPRSIDIVAPITDVTVTRWHERGNYGTLDLEFGAESVRLNVVGAFAVDVPGVISAISASRDRSGAAR